MVIDKAKIKEMFLSAAELMKEKSAYLSEIDSRFGDGDHGITVNKIALLIEKNTNAWGDESICEFIEGLGEGSMAVNGGSAGPLYGTMIGGFAVPLKDEAEIDAPLLKKMFAGSRDEMFDISKARVGDKTMMDTLIPAVEAALASPDDVTAIMKNAAAAAADGAKASEAFISKFGRARSYKEQTIGTPDAGAVSTAVFFEGLAKPF
ncbi:MAG: dihydroxyacetone kinase subunit L [Oscillospiraceae bacterium]